MKRGGAWLLGELLGSRVRVEHASSKSLRGLAGTLVDETKNTFVIETRAGRMRVPKAGNAFRFPQGLVDGRVLVGRPEERTKRLAKKKERR